MFCYKMFNWSINSGSCDYGSHMDKDEYQADFDSR